MKIQLELNIKDNDLQKVEDVLKKAGFKITGEITNLDDTLNYGFHTKSDLKEDFSYVLQNNDLMNDLSGEELDEFASYLSQNFINNKVIINHLDDITCESVMYEIQDYIDHVIDLKKSFSSFLEDKNLNQQNARTEKSSLKM